MFGRAASAALNAAKLSVPETVPGPVVQSATAPNHSGRETAWLPGIANWTVPEPANILYRPSTSGPEIVRVCPEAIERVAPWSIRNVTPAGILALDGTV